MELILLGTPAVLLDDGQSVPLPPGRPTRMLAALALEPGRLLERDELVIAVWDTAPPPSLRNALHVYVSRLRALLGSASIVTAGNGYRLTLPPESVDIARFERLMWQAAAAADAGDAVRAADLYAQAEQTYRAPLLAGESLSATLASARRRLSELYDTARERLLASRLSMAQPDEAASLVRDARALVDESPLRESRHALLVEALRRSGRAVDALAAYESATSLLRDRLGIEPGPDLRTARGRVLGGTGAGDEGGLDTPLIGRAGPIRVVGEMLTERRLVTVTGAGGVGKSAVAAEVVTSLGSEAGRVVRVDLSDTVSSEEVPQRIARAAGVADPASAGLDDVADALIRWQVLLLLESCEGVTVGPVVTALLDRLPQARVLATSERPLGAHGEVVVALAGLDAGTEESTPEELAESPGVRLYLQRAAEAGHPVHEAELRHVGHLVRRLDGRPLAIALVASLPDGGRPGLLVNRPLRDLIRAEQWDGVPRHRSMVASVTRSTSLLSEEARAVLATISELDPDVPDALAASAGSAPALDELIALSLAHRPHTADPRVRVPDLVREAVLAEVDPDGRAVARARLRRAIAEESLSLLELPLATARTPEDSERVQSLARSAREALRWPDPWESPHDHARALLLLVDAPLDRVGQAEFAAGLDAALTSGDIGAELRFDLLRARLGVALAGADGDVVEATAEALAEVSAVAGPLRAATARVDSVFLALHGGRFADAVDLAAEAVAAVEGSGAGGSALAVRAARAHMHAVRMHLGLDDGLAHALQAAALADLVDSSESISTFGEAAEILVQAGEMDLGTRFARRAARLALRWNSPHSLVHVLTVADIALEEGRVEESRAITLALLDRVWRRGDDRFLTWCLLRLAEISDRAGDAKRAATLLGASSTISGGAGWDSDPDACALLEHLPASLGGEVFRESFDRGAAAPRGWVAAVLDEPATLPSTLDPELLTVLARL